MTNKIYYLASCDTCRKIIKSLPNTDKLEFHDIRQNPITEKELEEMHSLSGSYEVLFSKKAQLYKSMDLKNKALTETDFKKYLLEQYTFLSRPVFIIDDNHSSLFWNGGKREVLLSECFRGTVCFV